MTIKACDWCGKQEELMAVVTFAPVAEAGAIWRLELCYGCECRVRTFLMAKGKITRELMA